MKHLLLAAAFVAATVSTGFAQSQQSDLPPQATSQEIQAAKQTFTTKLSQFQTAVTQNKTTQAEVIARQLISMMRTRAAQVSTDTHYVTVAQRPAASQRLDQLEGVERDFMMASKDMKNNGTKAVTSAQAFLTTYY